MTRHLRAWLAAAVIGLFMVGVYALLVWNAPLVMGVYVAVVVIVFGYAVTEL